MADTTSPVVRFFGVALLIAVSALLSPAAESIAILPREILLSGPESTQQILTLNVIEGNLAGETEKVTFTSSAPTIAVIENGFVIPKANGTATITAKNADGETATAKVTVRDFDTAFTWSFRNHVLPILSKGGCNAGACHGALAGKGGFRLSLRGYDAETDFHTITREARGRRVELGDPGRSLLLTKATTALKHTGGRRVKPDSRDYRILAEWISAGAAPPEPDASELESLEIFPPLSILKPGDSQSIVVRARYSDGREEDVTQWSIFSSSNEAVASVDETGRAEVIGHGEGAVTAWFSSQIVIARISSPFPNDIPEDVFTRAPRKNFVDELVLDQLRRLNLKPSPRANDSEFIRRVFVDTIGVLPTPAETRGFLADTAANKREKLIETLLNRPEFVDYWAYRWSDMLLVTGRKLRPEAVKAYYTFIRQNVENNTPWDEFARQVVTAKGSSVEEGATNFYAVHQDPENMAENVSQAFLSLSIGCAKCHNHPLEKWTNDQYYAFANLFSRVRGKGWGGDARNGDGIRTLYVEPRGDLDQPRTGKPQPPAPLDADPIPADQDTGDRREILAAWLTSPDNTHFSRSITNRVWANYFGIGLVDPVDDLRASNPASNEPLLAALSKYLVEQKFDLKSLMRLILQSETYQRSSEALYENREEKRFFSRQYPRRMMAEVLHDAVAGITGVPTEFNAVGNRDGSSEKTDFYPKGTRALELYDSAISSYFLKAFGRNDREISCECERSNQPSLVQVLHVSNGSTINGKLRAKGSVVDVLLNGRTDPEIVEEAYLLCLSRVPTARESEGFSEILRESEGAEKRAVIEDLFWALMSSREFLFQH